MLGRMIEKAFEEEIFSREDTPTVDRIEAAFLYHAGLSYRRVKPVVERSYEAMRQWYHRLAHLFEPEPDHHATVAVDETKVSVENDEVYVWAAVDVDSFEVVHVEVSPGRSDLNALLFLKQVLRRCRGQPVILVDRGPWYNWALDDLDLPCDFRLETWGERSLVKAWFGLFKYRTRLFYSRFPTEALGNQQTAGGLAVTVWVGDLPTGFYIVDDGPGIPSAERGQVFDPGYTTDDDSMSIGLIFVKQVAVAHRLDGICILSSTACYVITPTTAHRTCR